MDPLDKLHEQGKRRGRSMTPVTPEETEKLIRTVRHARRVIQVKVLLTAVIVAAVIITLMVIAW